MSSMRVLVIEDDNLFFKILEIRLKSILPHMELQRFDTLEAARNFFKSLPDQEQLPFDLVVLDEHLPDGRGIDLLAEGWFRHLAVLSVSSDDAPEIPGGVMQAGATYFLDKVQVNQPLFGSLIRGIMDRNKLQRELNRHLVSEAKMEAIRMLVGTLLHEINNPLGVVLNGASLIRNAPGVSSEQIQAAALVEASGRRIKHVLSNLLRAESLEEVSKADQIIFQVPGDEPWAK